MSLESKRKKEIDGEKEAGREGGNETVIEIISQILVVHHFFLRTVDLLMQSM